jgi:hypothetical protein
MKATLASLNTKARNDVYRRIFEKYLDINGKIFCGAESMWQGMCSLYLAMCNNDGQLQEHGVP